MALTLTATPDLSSAPPSVRISLSGATVPTTLQRQSADGTLSPVRTFNGAGVPISTTTVIDFEAPYGQQLTYIGNGTTASNAVLLGVSETWLIRPGRPERSVAVTIAEFGSRNSTPAQGVFRILGRPNPIVVTDGRSGPLQTSVTIRTRTLAELERVRLLLSDSAPLLLNVPASLGWGVAAEYISVTSMEETRLVEYAGRPDRYWTLPYVVVDAPVNAPTGGDGGIGTRTWADLALEAGTWGQADVLYGTWADASVGNRA